jgi:hypothetical protein
MDFLEMAGKFKTTFIFYFFIAMATAAMAIASVPFNPQQYSIVCTLFAASNVMLITLFTL